MCAHSHTDVHFSRPFLCAFPNLTSGFLGRALAVWLLLGQSCGPSSDDTGPGTASVSYQVLDPGQDALDSSAWTLTPGSRIGEMLVRQYEFQDTEVLQITQIRESETVTGWLVENEAGLMEAGDLRHGFFSSARMLMPAAPAALMSWLTDPFGLDPDRLVPYGQNPDGDSHARDAETVVLTPFATPSPFADNNSQYTLYGWRRLYERQSDVLAPQWLVDGIGLVPQWQLDEAVVLDKPMVQPSPGPDVALVPASGASLVATGYRPIALAALEYPDGSFLLHLQGEGTLNQVMISDMGSTSVSYAAPGAVCLEYRDQQFFEVTEDNCFNPEAALVQEDGTLVRMPTERIEHHDPYGNIDWVDFRTSGILLQTDEGVVHVSKKFYEDWSKPDAPVSKGHVITMSDGSDPPEGIWKAHRQADGSYVLGFGTRSQLSMVALWADSDELTPVKGPMLHAASARNSSQGREYYRVTADGRLEEILLRTDGVFYRPLARLKLPTGHAARAAVRLDGRRFLVFTHTRDLGYDTQWYHERNVATGQMEWQIDNELPANFGEGHLWFAEVPDSTAEPALPSIAETLTIRPLGRNLELCWPPAYGQADTSGWTLAGRTPHAVLTSPDGFCLLLVRPYLEVAILKMPGALWAHGPLPTAGTALVATAAQGSDGGWVSSGVPGEGLGAVTRVTPDTVYWENQLDAFGPAAPMAGYDPRLDAGRLGFYYRGDVHSLVLSPPDTGLPPYHMGIVNQITGIPGAPGPGSGITPFGQDGQPHLMTPEDAPEPSEGFESAGVQGGGLLLQDRVYHFAAPTPPTQGYGVGQERYVEPPSLPDSATGWRHEGMLFHGTLCGHYGQETLYCIDQSGQRELQNVRNVSPRQWWVTDIAPDPSGRLCPNSVDNSGCQDGRFWLLGATTEKPWVTLFDPASMSVTEFALADWLPGYPADPQEMFIESIHWFVPQGAATNDYGSPVSVIGVASAEGARYWLVRFAADSPTVLSGPLTLDVAGASRWGVLVQAEALPRLRPTQVAYDPNDTLAGLKVISPILGDVTSQLVGQGRGPM